MRTFYKVLIAILVVLALCISPFVIAPIANNIKAQSFISEVKKSAFPASTEVLEVVGGVGNTSGTGNHVELLAAVLVKSDLTLEQLRDYYRADSIENDYVLNNAIIQVTETTQTTSSMDILNLTFKNFENISSDDNLYIIQKIESAVFSTFDLRGN